MPLQFKNMNELVEYLGIVEQRLEVLEIENKQLRAIIPSKPALDGNLISKYVTRVLPQTNLISSSFYKRAFSVWGHFFVANLIISSILTVIYICIVTVFFGSFFSSLIHSIPK